VETFQDSGGLVSASPAPKITSGQVTFNIDDHVTLMQWGGPVLPTPPPPVVPEPTATPTSTPTASPVTIIQSNTTESVTSNDTCTASLSNPPTAGNFLLVGMSGNAITTAPNGWTTLLEDTGKETMWGYKQSVGSSDQSVVLQNGTTCVTVMIELSGWNGDAPVIGGEQNNSSPLQPSVNVSSAGGAVFSLYSFNGASAPMTVTDNSPSGVNNSQLLTVFGGLENQLTIYRTTTNPFSAAQPYTDNTTFSGSPANAVGIDLWIP
jgi:hypothetical protein